MIFGDRDLRDLVLIEQFMKAAIGDWLDLCVFRVPILYNQNAEYRNDDVPEIDLCFLVYGIPHLFYLIHTILIAKCLCLETIQQRVCSAWRGTGEDLGMAYAWYA